MGIPMIVKKAFRPGGSGSALVQPGSAFEASDKQQARLCRAMGWCEDAPAASAAPSSKQGDDAGAATGYGGGGYYATRETKAPVAKKVAAKKTASKAGGTYSRRDMTAE
jgi:hypothetical protein